MHRVEPKVFLVGQTKIDTGLYDYLKYIKTKWSPQNDVSDIESLIEFYGRLCYDSYEVGRNANVTKVREGNDKYIAHINDVGHGSVIEHGFANFVFHDISRVFTAELCRHRVGTAFSERSLRFVRLEDLGLWLPDEANADEGLVRLFEDTFKSLEDLQLKLAKYLKLDENNFEYKKKWTSLMRRVAPLGLSTVIGFSANMRTLRHLLTMRTPPSVEVEFRVVMEQVAKICKKEWPNAFSDYRRKKDGTWTNGKKHKDECNCTCMGERE